MRADTQPLVTIANAGLGWVSNFVSPYLINPDEANLGEKVGPIFGGLSFRCWIWAYFRFPETRLLIYVELAYLFNNKVNRRKFPEEMKKHREGLKRNGVIADENVEEGVVVHVEAANKGTIVHAEAVPAPLADALVQAHEKES